jgi:hypothetical protein
MEGMKTKNPSYRSIFKTETRAPRRAVGLRCALAFTAAFALGGCVLTPHTTIQGTLNGSPFVVKAPKDGDLTGFDLVADTNGVVHVHIDHLAVKMNPDVISQTGIAQTAIIKATGDAVANAAAAAAAGAVQGAKAVQ